MKIRLKNKAKVLFTIILVIVGIVLYRYLSFKGSYTSESAMASVIVPLGWFWLLFGQMSILYFVWEN